MWASEQHGSVKIVSLRVAIGSAAEAGGRDVGERSGRRQAAKPCSPALLPGVIVSRLVVAGTALDLTHAAHDERVD